jgi:hypothetical protein
VVSVAAVNTPDTDRARNNIHRFLDNPKTTKERDAPPIPIKITGLLPTRSDSFPHNGAKMNCIKLKDATSNPNKRAVAPMSVASKGSRGKIKPNPTISMKTLRKSTIICFRLS